MSTQDPIARQRPSGMPFQRYEPYQKQFAVDLPDRRWPARVAAAAPRWCAVDLRDGNQALIDPMHPSASASCSPAGEHGLQGDRGRLPGVQPDGLRVRPAAHRRGPDPRRRDHPGAHAVPRALIDTNVRVDPGRQAGDRAPLQLDLVLQRRVVFRIDKQGSSTSPRAARGCAGDSGDPSRRARTSSTSTRPRATPAPNWSSRSTSAPRSSRSSSRQPARKSSSTCRRRSRWRRPMSTRTRSSGCPVTCHGAKVISQPASAQRPRHCGSRRQSSATSRRRPHRGLPVRQRRAHRQRRPGRAGHQPVHPGHRPADRLQRLDANQAHRPSTATS